MNNKVFATAAEEILLISVLIFEKFRHPWRIASWKMLFIMCVIFGLSVLIAKEAEQLLEKRLFREIVIVSEKVTWCLYRVLCLVLYYLVFCAIAGYAMALCMGNNPVVIKYGCLCAVLHFWTSYLFDSMLGIRSKSPFDLEHERELEEIDREILEMNKELKELEKRTDSDFN